MSRSSELLKLAAAHLEDGSDPFHESFLVKHEVTLDECFDLAEHLAMGARILAWAMDNPLEAAAFMSNGANGMALDAVTRAMQKINLTPATEAAS